MRMRSRLRLALVGLDLAIIVSTSNGRRRCCRRRSCVVNDVERRWNVWFRVVGICWRREWMLLLLLLVLTAIAGAFVDIVVVVVVGILVIRRVRAEWMQSEVTQTAGREREREDII